MAIHHGWRQAERHAQLANFVLEQFAQRLQQLKVKRIGQAADVVVRLDGDSLAGFRAGRFNDVRVDGALRQPSRVWQLAGFGLEYFHEFAAYDLALGLRVGHPFELAHEDIGGVYVYDLDAKVISKGGHDLFGFVKAQQTMVDEHASKLIAYGLVQQGCGNGRVYTAGQAQDDFIGAHLCTYVGYGLFHIIGHAPVAIAAADLRNESGQYGFALRRMRDFRMELQRVEAAIFVGHAGNGTRRCGGHELEARRQGSDLVTMAHPCLEHAVAFGGDEILQAVQQARVAMSPDFGVAKFAMVRPLYLTAQLRGHGLHAVADAQYRYAHGKDGGRHFHRLFGVSGSMAA